MDNIIEATKIRKRYGALNAVDGVDLHVPSGTVLGLIGPNGAGKTTLLRSLLGLCESEGDIEVLGLDPRRQRARLLEEVCFIADTAVLPGLSRTPGRYPTQIVQSKLICNGS